MLLVLGSMLTLWAAVLTPLHAQTSPGLPPELEQRAHALYKQVMCPVCQGQTLDQSRSPVAASMRGIIGERLLAGESDAQILAFFVEAYGDSVLASPPRDGVALAVWLVPPFALMLGGVAVFLALRVLRRPLPATARSAGTSDERTEDTLDPYLRMVDREMGTGDGRAPFPAQDRT